MRILVISDVHGNADALRSVLEHAPSWDDVWVLGDLVDYGPEPHTVVDMIRDLSPGLIVRGNHDNAAAFGVDCNCDPKVHELSVYTRQRVTLALLSKEQLEWLRGLPLHVRMSVDGREYYAVHGSPSSPLYGYLYPDMPRERLLEALSRPGVRLSRGSGERVRSDVVIVGHTHVQFRLELDGQTVVNPGSVGQPRDGVPLASYMVIDTEGPAFSHGRAKYDVEVVLRKLSSLGIERRYYEWAARILTSASL